MDKEKTQTPSSTLPTPATLPPAHENIWKSKRLRIALVAFAAVFGWHLFSVFERQIELRRLDSQVGHLKIDPDARGKLNVKEAEQLFLSTPDPANAIKTSKLYATLPHLAGSPQDYETAKYFLEILQTELGISKPDKTPVYDAGSPESQNATRGIISRSKPSAWIDKYFPVMNRPLGRALDIVDDDGVAVWKADVEEDEDEGDPAGQHARSIGTWHGLSKGGDVTGRAVYVNYGRKPDFDALVNSGVNLTGTIAIVRYGGNFRGLKIKAAQEAGCIGTLIYTDPRDHGSVTEENGYKPYPQGPAINPTSVQRGSVQFLSKYPGDPTTPGLPAYENATRIEATNIPSIPSLPISWSNAQKILAEISENQPFELNGALSNRRIRLLNQVDTGVIPIWNVMGVIPGHITDEVVMLGNHRDAWVMGAADPTSGTVTVHEIIKGLGALLRKGWKPLRTIVIASWDAEEYGLIGSTEFGEDFPEFIKRHVVAYLNVDVSTAGSRLRIGGSPSLAHLVRGAAQAVAHPTDVNRTLWDAREDKGKFTGNVKEIGADHLAVAEMEASMKADPRSTGVSPLGSGSDYTVFLQRIGIASIDGGFGGTLSDAVYHYHSVFDSHQWQERYADPGFHRHIAIAKYLGLVTLRLSDSIILPINTTQYALQLESYLEKVELIASENSIKTDFSRLRKSITKLQSASSKLDHIKGKADRRLRKALSQIGKKSRHDHPHHDNTHHRSHLCAKNQWRKLLNAVKAVFGIKSLEHEVDHHGHVHTQMQMERGDASLEEERSSHIQKLALGKAAAQWKGQNRDLHEKRVGPLSGIRVGKAAAELPNEKREQSLSGLRVGKAGSGSWSLWEHGHEDHKNQHGACNRCHGRLVKLMQRIWNDNDSIDDSLSVPPELKKVMKAAKAVRRVNSKLAGFESGFISKGGIPDREWYRHLGVAPGKWLGYGATTFPALTEALDEKNSTLAAIETDRIVELLEDLTHFLKI